MTIGGQASGDFRLSTSALRVLYSLIKDTIPSLAADGLTQSNPATVVTAGTKSSTIPSNVKKGVLGGSVAFLRPDIGANTVGGAALVAAAYVQNTRPVGLFINDALGNAFENTPGVASGKGPFLRGGACGVKLYETQLLFTGGTIGGIAKAPAASGKSVGDVIGNALTYSVGDFLYASANGLLTNVWQDSLEAQWITAHTIGSNTGSVAAETDCTRMGVVLSPPDATTAEMFLNLAL